MSDKIKEIPDFLIKMSRQLKNQNNRITADPIFQVCYNEPYITEEGCHEYIEYAVADGDYSIVYSTEEGSLANNYYALDFIMEYHEDLISKYIDECGFNISDFDFEFEHAFEGGYLSSIADLNKYHMSKKMTVVKSCLTEADAKAFIARKQHDYKKLYIYVNSMVFCPQMIELRNWIMSLTEGESNE